MKRNQLISLAESFVAFLIENADIDQAILFGSVANNDFDDESDVDIFIETEKKNEKKIKKILETFEKSDVFEKYKLIGVKNNLSLKIGSLKEWPSLKRSILANGVVLYGKYKEVPKKLNPYIILSLEYKNLRRKEKIKLWRKIYGYKQKVGGKIYEKKGLAKIKLGAGCILIRLENKERIIKILKENKVSYKIYEIWTDILD